MTFLREIRDLIADDAHALTFQSFGQYRNALLKSLDAALSINVSKAAPVAYLVTNLPSGEPSLCFEEERGDYGDETHTPSFHPLLFAGQEGDAAAVVDAAQRLARRGFFAPSTCADSETAADMALMRSALAQPAAVPQKATAAARDVLAERRRQIDAEGWTPEHDDSHVNDEIAAMACFYAMPPGAREWSGKETGYGDTLGEAIRPEGWAAKEGDRRRELVKAAALAIAEIERLDRAAIRPAQGAKGDAAC